MKLHELSPAAGSRRDAFRKGRGHGSGNGKTAGRGHKGQKARSGGGVRVGFEGGQMPLARRIPKRGFHNIFAKPYEIVNLHTLNVFDDGDTVDAKALMRRGILHECPYGYKVLGNGTLTKKLNVKAAAFSESAKAAIEAAGGTAETVTGGVPRGAKTEETRQAKRVFRTGGAKPYDEVVSLSALNAFEDGDTVNLEALLEKGVLSRCHTGYKVLGNGTLTKKVTVQAAAFSHSAREAIEAAGGKAEVV